MNVLSSDRVSAVDLSNCSARKPLLGISLACAAVLMLSGFRAPEDNESLAPIFAHFKVVARLVSLGGLAGVILWCGWAHTQRTIQSAKLFFPLGLFCGYALCSALWSPLKAETLGQAGSLLTLVLLGYTISLLVHTPEDLSRLMAGLVGLLIFICLILLVTGLLLPHTGHMTRDGEGLGHSTYAGSTAALAALILTLCALLSSWQWPRVLFMLGMPILGAVMVISANRLSMAISTLLIGLAVSVLGSRWLTAGALICIGVVGTLFLMVDPNFGGVQETIAYLSRDQSSEEIGSLSGRSLMWEAMWDSFLESPVLGHGYFVTSSTGELYMWYSTKNWTAHNVALQALVTTGVVGFVLLVAGLAIPTMAFVMKTAAQRNQRRMKWFLIFMFSWYALWGVLNESIMGPLQPESVLFFAIMGAMVSATLTEAPIWPPAELAGIT